MLTAPVYNCDPHARPEGATVTTGELVAQVFKSASEPRQALQTLIKVVTNTMANPNEPKFKELRKANSLVHRSIVSVRACKLLLQRCGFVDKGDQFRLQASGLRLGELARLTVALSEYEGMQDLAKNLRELMENMQAQLGICINKNVQFAPDEEVRHASIPLKRPGWLALHGYDADPNEDAHSMPAGNLEACFLCAEENGFGGICVWEGNAYFREATGAELKLRLQRATGAAFYIYEPPFLRAPYSRGSGPSSSSMAGPLPVAPPIDDEDDMDLQEALRLSMAQSS